MQASYEPTDLAALTADSRASSAPPIERAGLQLIVDCPPLPEPVYVDREMWEKIVLNLLSNAFKFTFEGEIEVCAATSRHRRPADGARHRHGYPGRGVAAPVRALPPRQGRARARSYEGSGIGLALVQELVRLHGGTVGVESEVGRGSTFTVRVPLGKAHLPADRIGAARTCLDRSARGRFVEEALRWLPDEPRGPRCVSRDPRCSEPFAATRSRHRPAGRACVLVADDNADMRDYVAAAARRATKSRPWRTARRRSRATRAAARSGADGRDDAAAGRLRAVGALRADPRARRARDPAVGPRRRGVAHRGHRAGADDYLVKPFSARDCSRASRPICIWQPARESRRRSARAKSGFAHS